MLLALLTLAARPGEYDIARPFQSTLVQPGQPQPDWEAVAAGLRVRADDVQARINRLRGQMPTHTDPMAELDSAATARGSAGAAVADGDGAGRRYVDRRRDLRAPAPSFNHGALQQPAWSPFGGSAPAFASG